MIPNLFLDPDFLTIEQSAQFIGIPADIVLSLIEEYPFPTAVAIPSTPMVLVPEGKDDTMRMVFSNPEQYGDELKKWTEDQAGTFKVHPNAIKSVAINGSTSINKIWSLIPEDKNIRIDHLSEDEQKILKRRCYWLRQPIEISLSNIRIPLHFIKILHTLNDGRRKIREIEESRKEQESKEKPLHASEQNTIQDDESDSYHTQALDALHAAISQFWINYDPSRPPKSPEIVEWLMREHKMTQTMAASIDRVIRPEELRKGGNTKLS